MHKNVTLRYLSLSLSFTLSSSLFFSCSFPMADHHHGNSRAHRGTPTSRHCLGRQGSKEVLAKDNLQFPMIKLLHYQYRNGFDSQIIIMIINISIAYSHMVYNYCKFSKPQYSSTESDLVLDVTPMNYSIM